MRRWMITIITLTICTLSACSYFETGNIQNVGFLVETEIDASPWTEEGYAGMQEIEDKYQINVFYKEDVQNIQDVRLAVNEFVQDGVNLVFGHSNKYGEYFMEIAENYPDVQFVYVNGAESQDNVTSLNFDGHAMGFFGGMVAGEMSANNEVGIIAAHSWQPEIEGFYEGVMYINPDADIEMSYLNDWNNVELALTVYEEMQEDGVDIFYPIGNAFSEQIIKNAEEDGNLAIGYMTNQMNLAPDTVLTSTMQHVDQLYLYVAELFNKGRLDGDIYTFDFQDEFVSLGELNSSIPSDFRHRIQDDVEHYKETGNLPNEE